MVQLKSLHIGLNAVDPGRWGGWSGILRGCENDAIAMREVATACHSSAQVLLTKDATSISVLTALSVMAAELTAGDLAFVTYSGHGGQVPDLDGDEPDHFDETWALYDTQLRDDDIYKALTAFKPGVRILMLSDSCHSESVNRDMAMARESKRAADSSEGGKRAPLDVTVQEFEDHENQYLKRKGARPSDVTADVILISGCQDDQESRDGLTNGAFTRAFLDVWANGAFAGSHLALHDQVRARVQELGFAQVPGWNPLGGVDGSLDRFIQQQPLVV